MPGVRMDLGPVDADAPYGRKRDGTPRKKPPGRAPLSDAELQRRGTWQRFRHGNIPGPGQTQVAIETGSDRDYVAEAEGYGADVLGGAIVAGTWARLACERQQRDMARAERDPSWPFVFDPDRAREACAFVEQCPHVEGTWETETIRLQPPQVFWLCLLFGWRRRSDPSLRRFTTFYLEMGRKGAKSTLMAAIGLFHMLREGENGPVVICGATTGLQARIVFSIMQRMVKSSRWLRAQGLHTMVNAIITADGTAKPVNAKASTQDGLNPSCIILDESHAQNYELHNVLKSAQGARANPLLMAPTTAGYDLLSVGYGLRSTAQKILQGVFEADHFLVIVYAIDEGDDWRDPRVWPKANPMLGVTPKIDKVRQDCIDAQQTPGLESEFRVKVCSEWMQAASAWLSITQWDACADTVPLAAFAGQPCWMGTDLAQLDDLAAKALLFDRDGILYAFVQFYLPAGVVAERARTVPAYQQWVNLGVLTVTDGQMIDYDRIMRDVRADCKTYKVNAIVGDEFGSGQFIDKLAADGYPAIIQPKNAKAFTAPAKDLEARVKHRRFRHDGNPCLKWNASNAVVDRRTDDSMLPKKETPQSPNKIDGIDAILEAMIGKMRTPAPAAPFLLVLGAR